MIAIADGFAQATGLPVLVNMHTSASGNGMGNLVTAFQNKSPLIVTAGNQTREMLLLEPFLTNVEATLLPQPWVKWSYQPMRAEDVPALSCVRLRRLFSHLQVRSFSRFHSMIGRSRASGRLPCGW